MDRRTTLCARKPMWAMPRPSSARSRQTYPVVRGLSVRAARAASRRGVAGEAPRHAPRGPLRPRFFRPPAVRTPLRSLRLSLRRPVRAAPEAGRQGPVRQEPAPLRRLHRCAHEGGPGRRGGSGYLPVRGRPRLDAARRTARRDGAAPAHGALLRDASGSDADPERRTLTLKGISGPVETRVLTISREAATTA